MRPVSTAGSIARHPCRMPLPDLYGDLAPWFHLLTAPKDYDEEARLIHDLLRKHVDGPVETLLELGAGGGNTASHPSGA